MELNWICTHVYAHNSDSLDIPTSCMNFMQEHTCRLQLHLWTQRMPFVKLVAVHTARNATGAK